jgi:phage/plasmid-like protein (TIGR03299 family)
MGHNLFTDTKSGQTAMFCATGKRGLPWHKLGQMVVEAQSWEEAAKLAHLDFTVYKKQLIHPLKPDTLIPAHGIFRDDTGDFLGVVGDVYQPIQTAQAFDFVDTLLEAEKGAHYESAGLLGHGERFWVLARVPYEISIDGTDDKNFIFLLFESSHDGTLCATAKICVERVVCENTLNIALGEKSATVKIRHSGTGTEKLEAAKKMLTGVKQTVASISDKLNTLAHRQLTPKHNDAIMSALFGSDWKDSTRKRNQIEKIGTLFASNDHNAIPEIKGTAYNMLNAVTEYADHFRSVRVTEGKENMTEVEVRAEGAMFGNADQFKQEALSKILALTGDCPVKARPIFSRPQSPSSVNNILAMVA